MLPFRRVLFPVDYSQPCEAIVPYVADMVRHFNAELTLAHAYGPYNVNYSDILAADTEWGQRVQGFEEGRLEKFACSAFPSLRADLRVKQGEPADVIKSIVDHEGTDLVMMPTRGQGILRRFLLGSVTAKMLHDATTAIWTGVGSALDGHHAEIPYRSIVCALDSTEDAEVVLRAAASLAKSYDAKLSLVHVVVIPPPTSEIDFSISPQELMDAAEQTLQALKSKLGIEAPHLITDAPIVDGIRAEALNRKADLPVVGRGSAQAAVSRIWSHLYTLIRESPCPVLSI